MTSPGTILTARGLRKRFGGKVVLRGVDLSLEPGRHLGLVGNNGEGKTTLLRILLGLLPPDGGEIRIAGEPAAFPRGNASKRRLGYLPESVSFYPNLTGRRTLRFLARLKGAPAAQVEEALERVGLRHAGDERVRTYSRGMRQRLGLAQCLLGSPELLVLDEPTTGLDPEGIRGFYRILEGLQAQGVAILTASHLLAEIQTRLDGLALLRDGVFRIAGPVERLIAQAGLPTRIRFSLREPAGALAGTLARLGATPSPNGHPHAFELRCGEGEKLAVLAELLRHREALAFLTVHEPGLEDVFHHYQGDVPPASPPGGEGPP
jgi:Cu-processing system ATP-binding protein